MAGLRHDFDQVPDAGVQVCRCGKWPLHHVHTGHHPTCTCDDSRALMAALSDVINSATVEQYEDAVSRYDQAASLLRNAS